MLKGFDNKYTEFHQVGTYPFKVVGFFYGLFVGYIITVGKQLQACGCNYLITQHSIKSVHFPIINIQKLMKSYRLTSKEQEMTFSSKLHIHRVHGTQAIGIMKQVMFSVRSEDCIL